MRYLIDTHVLIWAFRDSARLPARVANLLSDPANEILVSAVTAYEIEFKRPRSSDLQKLPADLSEGVAAMDFHWLAISHEHAILAGRLPRLHGDPFDRLLAAQALVENATLVTSDPWIAPYGAPVVW